MRAGVIEPTLRERFRITGPNPREIHMSGVLVLSVDGDLEYSDCSALE